MEFTLISNPCKFAFDLWLNPMKTSEAKYFLALLPKEPLASDIFQIKKEISAKFNTKGALKSPAHLTLHMPFLWKERNEQRLIQLLVRATKYSPFNLFLDGFGAFPPRTIYIKNKESAKLRTFHKEFISYTKQNLKLLNTTHNRGFHPHITVAFRDLKKEAFDAAWPVYQQKTYEAKMLVDSFWLLKHDGRQWHPFHEFPFVD